jgi:hypothetical protein
MAGALAAAVERLRARAEEPVADGMRESATTASGRGAIVMDAPAAVSVTAAGRAERPPASRPVPSPRPPVPLPTAAQARRAQAPKLPQHKHSLSWIGRWRIRRKQRRRR